MRTPGRSRARWNRDPIPLNGRNDGGHAPSRRSRRRWKIISTSMHADRLLRPTARTAAADQDGRVEAHLRRRCVTRQGCVASVGAHDPFSPYPSELEPLMVYRFSTPAPVDPLGARVGRPVCCYVPVASVVTRSASAPCRCDTVAPVAAPTVHACGDSVVLYVSCKAALGSPAD
jgi:hypothetical protein